MRKISLLITSFLILLCFVSCNNNKTLTTEKCQEQIVNLFENEYINFRADIETKNDNMNLKLKIFDFKKNKQQSVLDFSNTSIINEDLMLYIQEDTTNSCKLFLGNTTTGIKTKKSDNIFNVDFNYELENQKIEENTFYFTMKINQIDEYQFEVLFNSNEIKEIKMKIPMQENQGFEVSLIISEISTTDNQFYIPSYTNNYQLTDESSFQETFNNLLESIIQPGQTPEPDPVITYRLVLEQEYEIAVWQDKMNNITGKIVGSDNSTDYCDVKLITEIPFHKPGRYDAEFSCDYLGETYTCSTIINIVDSTVEFEKLNINIDNIKNTFSVDNFLYITTNERLYRYNLVTNQLDSNYIDLKCEANKIVPYNNFLYILAHYEYSSEYLDEYDYRGTITKVYVDNFTVNDQMDVNYFPYDIEFEDENILYISKGLNQHVSLEKVNLKEKTSTKFLNSYEKDNLLYDKENNIFYLLNNNSSKYVFDKEKNEYVENYNTIFGPIYNYLRKNNYIFTMDGYFDISDFNNIRFKNINFNVGGRIVTMAYDSKQNTIYYLYENYSIHNYALYSYSLNDDTINKELITVKDNSFNTMNAYDGKIYLYNQYTSSYDVINTN